MPNIRVEGGKKREPKVQTRESGKDESKDEVINLEENDDDLAFCSSLLRRPVTRQKDGCL